MMRVLLTLGLLMATSAGAETVTVKYAGEVDLSGYDCAPTKPSSFVNRICYDEAQSHLIVLLGETYYQYCGIPTEVVAEWRASESLGRFYNANVKTGLYDCN